MSSISATVRHFAAFAAVVATIVSGQGLCNLIDSHLPGLVSHPSQCAFKGSQASYYTGQERDIIPECVFRPRSTQDVSQFVTLLAANGSRNSLGEFEPQFAVRGGGHTLYSGAANIEGGITVDLRAINSFELSDDLKVASLGGGAAWSNVYPKLEAYNLTIPGARIPGVGVGGFALGGGAGFLSRRNGWTCDNVYGYEVVLANGEVVYATSDSNSDLWLALKGGSSNFGIVTRYDIATFPQDLMWGGIVAYNYTEDNVYTLLEAFSDYMHPENFDDSAMMNMIVGFNAATGFSIMNSLFYMDPVENPPAFEGFMSVPTTMNTMNLDTVSGTVEAFGAILPPSVTRASQLTYSFKNSDISVYTELFRSWERDIRDFADIDGLSCQFLLQPQPVTNGTNSLGLTAGELDIVLVDMTIVYNNAADDAKVLTRLELLVNKHIEILNNKGLLIPFKYLNYADHSQHPIDSYGTSVKQQLQSVSRKYDPSGLFQRAMPGGSKLFS